MDRHWNELKKRFKQIQVDVKTRDFHRGSTIHRKHGKIPLDIQRYKFILKELHEGHHDLFFRKAEDILNIKDPTEREKRAGDFLWRLGFFIKLKSVDEDNITPRNAKLIKIKKKLKTMEPQKRSLAILGLLFGK